MSRRLPITLFVLSMSLPVLAEPATRQRADSITSSLETYFGRSSDGPSALFTVKPKGGSYELSFDLSRIASALLLAGYAISPSPYVSLLTPRKDGTR
jgi:hypothetical protein